MTEAVPLRRLKDRRRRHIERLEYLMAEERRIARAIVDAHLTIASYDKRIEAFDIVRVG